MTVDREKLEALGYRVIDGKNRVVQSGWLAIPPGNPPTVGIGATEGDAWAWAIKHYIEAAAIIGETDRLRAALEQIASTRIAGWGANGAVDSFNALTGLARAALESK